MTRAAIGKYACVNGVAAASHYFSRKLKKNVNETTVRFIKLRYLEEVKRKRALEEDEETQVTTVPMKKRGRPLLIGETVDDSFTLGGGSITAGIAIAAAKGLILKYDKTKLSEYGGPIQLNRHWTYSLLKRMNFVKRKATTAKSKYSSCNLRRHFWMTMEEIPPELILNWDQTGIRIVPCASWTMDQKGARRVEIIGTNDKRQSFLWQFNRRLSAYSINIQRKDRSVPPLF